MLGTLEHKEGTVGNLRSCRNYNVNGRGIWAEIRRENPQRLQHMYCPINSFPAVVDVQN
jgi:hypothetical protein